MIPALVSCIGANHQKTLQGMIEASTYYSGSAFGDREHGTYLKEAELIRAIDPASFN